MRFRREWETGREEWGGRNINLICSTWVEGITNKQKKEKKGRLNWGGGGGVAGIIGLEPLDSRYHSVFLDAPFNLQFHLKTFKIKNNSKKKNPLRYLVFQPAGQSEGNPLEILEPPGKARREANEASACSHHQFWK